MIQPPKISPFAFVSAGSGEVRSSSSPSGDADWMVRDAALF